MTTTPKKLLRLVHFVVAGRWQTACGQRFGRRIRTQLVVAVTCGECKGSEAYLAASRARLERLASAKVLEVANG